MSGKNIEIVKLQIRRGLESQLPILDQGEPAITTDTNKIFVGNGITNHELAHKVDLDTKAAKTDLGDLTSLNTTDKSSIVNALKEIKIQANGNQTSITNIGNASPKGAYATVSALQTAFPTGATGVYVVTADGNWYYWSGSSWTVGGIYQSTGVATGSITEDKTSFFKVGKNLFNPATLTDGYYVDYTHGTLAALAGYTSSDYIQVQPNTQYTCTNASNLRFAFYDSSKNFLSGNNANLPTITTPANTAYVRYSFTSTTLNTQQFELGAVATSYESYGFKLDATKVKSASITSDKTSFFTNGYMDGSLITSGSIPPEKTTFIVGGKNLFNLANATDGYYVDYNTGNLVSNSSYTISDYIPVQPSTQYSMAYDTILRIGYYDSSKIFLSGSNAGVQTITTPANAFYVRYSFTTSTKSTQQFEKSSTPTTFEAYYSLAMDGSLIKKGTITSDKMLDGTLSPEKMSFFVKGKNLFNPATSTSGYYINYGNGMLAALAGYTSSDYIPVQPNAQYTMKTTGNMRWAYYNSGKVYISGDGTNIATITTPSGAAYLRFSFNNDPNSQQLELGASSTSFEPYFGIGIDGSYIKPQTIDESKLLPSMTSYDPTEIVVDMKPDTIKFYIKGGNSQSNKYLRYQFKHDVVPFDPTGTIAQSNMDEWRLCEVYQCTRTGQWTFTDDYSESIVNTGEWECALHEKGASDFMGGWNHGDEVLTNAFVQFDGVKKDFSTTQIFACKHIKFVQQSQLYRVFTQTPVANHLKVYEITAEQGVHVYQEVKWLTSLTLINTSYLTMFPIKRTLSTGTQITDRFYRDSDYSVVDVSTTSLVTSSGAGTWLSGINHGDIWGTTSGISGRVTILQKPNISGESMFVSNSDSYNKFYFAICGGDYTTTVNEVMKMETIFKLDITL